MEGRLQDDNVAEVALSAMVSMIMIILFSAIISGMALMIVEQAFMDSKSQSINQSETLNSVPYVLTFEVESIDAVDNTNDDCIWSSSSRMYRMQFSIHPSNGS